MHTDPLPVNPSKQIHLRSPLSTPQKAFWSHATSETVINSSWKNTHISGCTCWSNGRFQPEQCIH